MKQNPKRENTARSIREGLLRLAPLFFALVAAGLLLAGLAEHENRTLSAIWIGIFSVFAVLRTIQLFLKRRKNEKEDRNFIRAVEPGVLLFTAIFCWVGFSGGMDSALFPLLYVAVTAIALFSRREPTAAFLAYAVLLTLAYPLARGTFDAHPADALGRGGLMLFFGALRWLALRIGYLSENTPESSDPQTILGDLERQARQFRKMEPGMPEKAGTRARRMLEASSVFEIRRAMQELLSLLSTYTEAHSAVVLWYDRGKKTLRVTEALTNSSNVVEREFPSESGPLHAVVTSASSIRVNCSRWQDNPFGYYRVREPLFALCATPILHHKRVHGVLVLDRTEEREFTDEEMEAVKTAALQISRMVASENLLSRLERNQDDYHRLTEASKELAKTLERDEVLRVSLETSHTIIPYDLGAIVLFRPEERAYEVVAVWPPESGMQGATFFGENNLVDWVVRKNQALTYPDFANLPKRPTIFHPNEKLDNVASLLIVPLNVQAKTEGALVLIHGEARAFTDDHQHIFEILANQIAGSLENARMIRKLENMAISDGLTGLHNKRYFNERMDEILSRAERYEQKLSLMMMDLDHFKKINDTYGHPVGDLVLREVSKTLRNSLRKIDLLARYGGEEFVLILDSTAGDQALLKAEELREAVADLAFDTDLGSFHAHMSVGIAVFPDDSRHKEELLEKADVALYQSKKAGRNRTTLYGNL